MRLAGFEAMLVACILYNFFKALTMSFRAFLKRQPVFSRACNPEPR
jgi:hypothetical protein